MIYLLDANVLIVAKNTYYSMDRVPEFWAWLLHNGREGNVKIPQEIFDELRAGNDELSAWLSEDTVGPDLLLDEDVNIDLLREVVDVGYAPDLADDELEYVGNDPFLVAHAYVDPTERVVITEEVSKPSRVRAQRHVPDICDGFNIQWGDTFRLTAELDFRTNWDA